MENGKTFFACSLIFHFLVTWFITRSKYEQNLSGVLKSQNSPFWWTEIAFSKDYEVSRREAQRFSWQQWREFKTFMENVGLRNSSQGKLVEEQFLEVLARHQLLREKDGYDVDRQKLTQFVSGEFQLHPKKLPQNIKGQAG